MTARGHVDVLKEGDVPLLLASVSRLMVRRQEGWVPPLAEDVAAVLPQFGIVELIGRGGMAAVYKGVQKSLGRPVAVKVLPPGLAEDPMNFEERFKREAEALARLSHPGIVTLLDAGTTAAGMLYLVMEFVEGASVERLLGERGRLSPSEVRDVGIQVCEALHAAHEAGIVHRDIKPSNIIVSPRGLVKLVDFGLAKPLNAEGRFTQSNFLIGTPEFIAPEASLGMKDVDHRADIYSLGVTLYAMLTGQVPRGAADPPSECCSGICAGFDAVVARAMRHDRGDRHGSALEMIEELRKVRI